MVKRFILAIWIVYCSTSTLFATTLTFSPKQDVISLEGTTLNYWIAKQPLLSHQVGKLPNSFKPINARIVNLGFEANDVWFEFTINNNKTESFIRMLHLNNPIIDEVDVYQKMGTSTWVLVAKGGDQRPYTLRKDGARQLIFPLEIPPKEHTTFRMRVNNGGEQFYFRATLEKKGYLGAKLTKSQLFYGILFGIMGFIILLNLSMGILFKQRIAYLYTAYGFFFALLQLSLLGFGTTWLWTDEYFISNRANPVFATLGVLFFLYFTVRFLKIEQFTPRYAKFILLSQYVLFVNLILAVLPGGIFLQISAIIVNLMSLVLNIAIVYPLVVILRKRFKPAKSYLLAFSILQVSVFAFVLRNFGIIPDGFFTENGLQIGTAIEMIILTIGILQRFKLLNDESLEKLAEVNALKENINEQLEIEVADRTREVIHQRNQLALKNDEIVSSIQYAKRIQQAILPSISFYQNYVKETHLFYAPKDIVAGDFYWMRELTVEGKSCVFFAVADCTGHGVPGAMMSVLCMNALNESVTKLREPSPGKLLSLVNDYLRNYLTSEDGHLADGMDISLGCYCLEQKEIKWSGANNPLWKISEKELTVYKPTKRPVGKSDLVLPFVELVIPVSENDRFLLFTDGYIDQFGGPNGKKLKTNGLKSIVASTAHLRISDQMIALQNHFENWRHEEEQIDDVCCMLISF